MFNQRERRRGLAVNDDVDRLVFGHGQPRDAHGGAHCVKIGKAVAHDEHAGGLVEKLGQGLRHDTGLDLGAALHRFGLAAEKFQTGALLDGGLVAAASQRQVEGLPRQLVVVGKALAAGAHADGDGGLEGAVFS